MQPDPNKGLTPLQTGYNTALTTKTKTKTKTKTNTKTKNKYKDNSYCRAEPFVAVNGDDAYEAEPLSDEICRKTGRS